MRKMQAFVILMFAICLTAEAQSPSTSQAGTATSAASNPYPTIPMKESKAHIVTLVKATYPAIAILAHVSGVVLVGAQVDANGDVTQAVATSHASGRCAHGHKAIQVQAIPRNGSPAIVRAGVEFELVPGRSKSVE
jgi:hypothetical protein